MAGTLRNMLVRVGADVSGLRAGLNSAQKQVKGFGASVRDSLKGLSGQVATTMAGLSGGFFVASAVKDAMEFEALMTTIGEQLGKSIESFQEWQNESANALGFSRLQSAKTASLLSLNFRTIASSQEDLTQKTIKMMEGMAIISNKRGMYMTEVSDRIRSAMNGEADGADELGINVRVASLQMTESFQQMANGKPWDQLSDSMRKTIIYNHLLAETANNLGTEIQNNTAMRMQEFTSVLADVKLALGQAFLPILYSVLPTLTTLAQALYKVMVVIGGFMRALFGGGFKFKAPVGKGDVKNTQAQASAMKDVGKEAEKAGKKSASAGKKAKEAWTGTFGFDEVNTIDDPKDTAGAGAGGGAGGAGDMPAMPEPEVPKSPFEPYVQAIDELAQKMKKYTDPIKNFFKLVWGEVSGFAKEEFAKISKWWNENGAQIIQGAKNVWGFIGPIVMAVLKFIWDSVKMVVDGVITTFMGIVEFFTGIFTGDFKMAWEGIKKIFFGVLEALLGFWNLSFIGGLKKLLFEFAEAGIKKIVTFVDDFKRLFDNGVASVKDFFKMLFDAIRTRIHDAREFIAGRVILMETSFRNLWLGIKAGVQGAVDTLKRVWGGVKDWFMRTLINPLIAEFDGISKAFSKGPVEGIKYLINKLIDGFNDALNVFNNLKNKTPFADKIPNLRIPKLAQGGITSGPTLAMVGDNIGGREVISPLDRLQSMLTNSVLTAMSVGGGGNQNSGDLILNIDGRAFARIVKPFLDREQNRVGNDIRIRTI
jgi:hypothetical protein